MKTRLLMLLMLSSFALFISCGDDEEKPSDFSTRAEADLVLAQEGEENITDIVSSMDSIPIEALLFNGSFDYGGGDSKLKKVNKNNLRILSGGYNSTTGWWMFDTSKTDTNGSVSFSAKMRFTPRNSHGLADSTTDKVESSLNASLNIFDEGSMSLKHDFIITGLVAYQKHTGSVIVNGIDEWSSNWSYDGHSQEAEYKSKFNAITISPTATYPIQSGSLVFTIKTKSTPALPDDLSYFIRVTITFNGTRYASLAFGGWNYTIDLVTGETTPVS